MPFRKELENYVTALREAHGENLVSVIFYGSATLKDEPGRDEIHLLITLKSISAKDLDAGAASMQTWMKGGYPAPVYFTESELDKGADVFPIEFNHMMRARKVIHGKDVLGGVTITDSNLRHQVEFELRSKLLRLRRAVIELSPKGKDLVALMANSLPSFISTMRAAVLLKTGDSHIERSKVAEVAAAEFGLDGEVFKTILDIRAAGDAVKVEDAEQLFERYLAQIEKVIKTVDSL